MGKRLIVAEKKSVGQELAKTLNCREKADGAIIGDNDIVTWARGHLVELCEPEALDEKYKEWKSEDLPIFPDPFRLQVSRDGEKQFNIIKTWMNYPEIDSIVCATDAGREGELIFRYIYQLAGCKKPVERLWISSLTYSAIKKGFENLKSSSEYDNLYQSARCRSEADWLIGMNGSRAFAIANEKRGLSVGRVTSPTLAILVDRELERRNFRPEEYCELVISYDGWEGRMINPDKKDDPEKWSRFAVTQKADLQTFASAQHMKARVVLSDSIEETIPPLQLYDLTSLQRDANRLYNYSSKYTLDMAQNLYEKKAITYPRTDSRYLSADIKSTLNKRLESLCNGVWDVYARQALQSERNLFGRFINDGRVTDHHAIIPTGEAKEMEKWSKGEQHVYDLISRRFIGMFFADRVVSRQTVRTCIDDAEFLSFGEKAVAEGWSAVDHSHRSSVRELPEVSKGDIVRVRSMRVRTDQTRPPAPHTEASLLNAMEHAGKITRDETEETQETEYGIGTPATRADIIEKLLKKGMVERKGRALVPTKYGIRLIDILPDFICSPQMTGEWEARLNHISKGEEAPEAFMNDIRDLTSKLVKSGVEKGDQGLKDANVVGTCPLCGNKVREYTDAYYCENKECSFRRIWKARKGVHPTLSSNMMQELLDKGEATTDKGVYTIIRTEPYISFERAEKREPEFDALRKLISDYGLEPVNKVLSGGALWFEGERGDETMRDFASDCSDIGCSLQFASDARALKHKSGWYLEVKPEHVEAFRNVFDQKTEISKEDSVTPAGGDPVLDLVKESGFEYIDKREKKGGLWIVAGEEEAKQFVKDCKDKGIIWTFAPNGSRSTKHKPGWYCR